MPKAHEPSEGAAANDALDPPVLDGIDDVRVTIAEHATHCIKDGAEESAQRPQEPLE
jgi:hypothetical protein